MPAVKARLMLRGLHAVDRRSQAAREVLKWRAKLVAELAAASQLSTATTSRIEVLVRTKLLLEHLDASLLEHTTLFGKKGRLRQDVRQIIGERNRMADSLERGLAALGQAAKGSAAALPSIDDLVAAQDAQQSPRRRRR